MTHQIQSGIVNKAEEYGISDWFYGLAGTSTEEVNSIKEGIENKILPRTSLEIYSLIKGYSLKFLNKLFDITNWIEEFVETTIQETYDYYDDLPAENREDEKDGVEYILYLLDHVLDYRDSYEYLYFEKIYYGETYSQFYNKYGDYEGDICLQNDWAHKIRSKCENLDVTGNGYRLKGCQYPHHNIPDRCGLRYNYNKHILEPTQNYCRAFGIGPIQKTSANHQVELQLEKDGDKKKYDTGNMPICKNSVGQEIAEFIIGTTLTRIYKDLGCSIKNECCSAIDCSDKTFETILC